MYYTTTKNPAERIGKVYSLVHTVYSCIYFYCTSISIQYMSKKHAIIEQRTKNKEQQGKLLKIRN